MAGSLESEVTTPARPRVVLGVSGGIAAYKAVDVCRRLVDAGVHVVPVLTAEATRFVGEVTFSALASEPVQRSLWDEDSPIPHTRLGQTADLIVVVPATAHTIARYAAGLSDDLLTATLLATRAPVLVCPAMHTEMWEHPSVRDNLALLERRGVEVIPPESGRLAGGDSGEGRLAEPAVIVERILARLGAAPADARPRRPPGRRERRRNPRTARSRAFHQQPIVGQARPRVGGRGGAPWRAGHAGDVVSLAIARRRGV